MNGLGEAITEDCGRFRRRFAIQSPIFLFAPTTQPTRDTPITPRSDTPEQAIRRAMVIRMCRLTQISANQTVRSLMNTEQNESSGPRRRWMERADHAIKKRIKLDKDKSGHATPKGNATVYAGDQTFRLR